MNDETMTMAYSRLLDENDRLKRQLDTQRDSLLKAKDAMETKLAAAERERDAALTTVIDLRRDVKAACKERDGLQEKLGKHMVAYGGLLNDCAKIAKERDEARAASHAQLSELEAISDALGTREGHSSVEHIKALRAKLDVARAAFQNIYDKCHASGDFMTLAAVTIAEKALGEIDGK